MLIPSSQVCAESERGCVQQLLCRSCNAIVGVADERAEGWRVYKWSMALTNESGTRTAYSTERWASAQLLAAIENEGVRKFFLQVADSPGDGQGLVVGGHPDSKD